MTKATFTCIAHLLLLMPLVAAEKPLPIAARTELPEIISAPGPEFQDEARPGAMIIGMDRTPKGRIWGCWTGTGDKQDGYFLLATSDDDGATWSKPRLAVGTRTEPKQKLFGALIGNLWTDPKGRLWLFFDQQLGDPQKRITNWFIRCDDPDAAEPAWSTPVMFAEGCTLNKPTVLKDGAWLLPVSDFHKKTARAYESTDEGATWKARGHVQFPDWESDEHMMVELKDGRLWMLARTTGQPHESFSNDGGKTWSTPKQAATVQNLNARFFLRRLQSGRILLVKNGSPAERLKKRTHMSAWLSEDEGQTWKGGLILDERNEVSYPDGFESPDGLIHILYDWNRHTDAEILLAKFREADVLAGKVVSQDAKLLMLANKARLPASIRPDPTQPWKWAAQAAKDAKQDFTSIPFDGKTPNKLACDTTLRELPDGSWVMAMLGGGDNEPRPENHVLLTRSHDKGKTWSPMQPLDFGFPREGNTIAMVPSELMVLKDRCTLFFATHDGTFAGWKEWMTHSEDSCRTWSKPAPAPGRLHDRTFIRNHILTKDGRILLPFQHYKRVKETKAIDGGRRLSEPTDSRNGVLMSADGGKTWTEHGDIRISKDDTYYGWAENNIVELGDGRIAMIIRADRYTHPELGGVLYYAESKDGGKTWPEFAVKSDIPNPGTKATLYPLGGDTVALLHNPNPKGRHPLALWISFDGMKTWPYQRVLVEHSSDGPGGLLNYPDGFVSKDKQWLHFAYDDNRHRAVHYSAKLPPLP